MAEVEEERASSDAAAVQHSLEGRDFRVSSASRRLEIVLAHYAGDAQHNQAVVDSWSRFLAMPKVAAMEPYVIIYCQNPGEHGGIAEALAPILAHGQVVPLNNIGREGRAYLHHIVHNYDRLPAHTLFSQDLHDDPYAKFEVLLTFLAVAAQSRASINMSHACRRFLRRRRV